MKKSQLNRIEIWAKIISYTIIPVIIGIIGLVINNSIESSKINAQYIEVAVKILQDQTSDPSLKEYAVNLINEFSPVKLDQDIKAKFIKGDLTLPSNIISSLNMKEVNENLDKITSSPPIKKWIEKNIPPGAKMKHLITYNATDMNSPYALVKFEINGIEEGKSSQWWLEKKPILKAEGFKKDGKSSGWWNFYDKQGIYEVSRLYDPTKKGAESLIKTSKEGPMPVGSLEQY